MNRIDWINYINKKIDQELNETKFLGASTWAILVIFATLMYSAFNDIINIWGTSLLNNWGLAVFVILTNLVLVVTSLYNIFPNFKLRTKFRQVNSVFENLNEMNILTLHSLLFSIVIGLNSYLILNFEYKINKWPFLLFIGFLLYGILFFVLLIANNYVCCKSGVDVPSINNVFEKGVENIKSKMIYIGAHILLVIIGILMVFSCRYDGEIVDFFYLIKLSMKIILAFYLLLHIKLQGYLRHKVDILKAFEEIILLDEIDDELIATKYKEMVLGLRFDEWILNNKQKLDRLRRILKNNELNKSEDYNLDKCKIELDEISDKVKWILKIKENLKHENEIKNISDEIELLRELIDSSPQNFG